MQLDILSTRIYTLFSWFNWSRWQNKIVYFVLLQLFITAISLPILIWWGLPISIATPIGNLLFGPLLTIFLFISSFIFFTELAHLPNGTFIWALEKVSAFWHWLAECGSKSYLISFTKPPVWFIITLPIAAFLIIQLRFTHPPKRSIIAFTIAILLYCFALKYFYAPQAAIDSIPCNGKELQVLRMHKELIIIDTGVLGSRVSATSWASYNFLQELSARYGTQTIDHLIILQPGAVTFEALTAIVAKAQVKKLYVPWWEQKLPYPAWRNYKMLMDECNRQHVTVFRIGKYPKSIVYTDDTFLSIEPLDQMIAYHEANYHAMQVNGSVDNQTFRFYSSKSLTHKKDTFPEKKLKSVRGEALEPRSL